MKYVVFYWYYMIIGGFFGRRVDFCCVLYVVFLNLFLIGIYVLLKLVLYFLNGYSVRLVDGYG